MVLPEAVAEVLETQVVVEVEAAANGSGGLKELPAALKARSAGYWYYVVLMNHVTA